MTPPIIIELGFRGVIIPAAATKAKLYCPDCTDGPHPWRKCMTVWILGDTVAETYCHHCKTPKRIFA